MILCRCFFFALLLFHGNAWLFAQEHDQHVILISLDGYRYDYTDRFNPPHISHLVNEGVSAKGMIRVFPTKTFPNHYSIATGMKPAKNGLVDNTFFDPERGQVYKIHDRAVVQDGSWYGGMPIWSLAEKNGIRAASYFFVGSEADIAGIRPSYYYEYDGKVDNLTRINQVLDWLALPESERPRLITIYFSDMDDVGHRYGPDNDEKLREAILKLDAELGTLFDGIKKFDLNINIILVSDHGMTNITQESLIDIKEIMDGIPANYYNNGALAHVHLDDPSDERKVWKRLRRKEGDFKIVDPFSRQYYGKKGNYSDRVGDFLIIPKLGHYLVEPSGFIKYQNRAAMFKSSTFGEHGFHPDFADMHAIFYASGPALKDRMIIDAFENTHVYPLVCTLLGLPVPKGIDGKLSVLEGILKKD